MSSVVKAHRFTLDKAGVITIDTDFVLPEADGRTAARPAEKESPEETARQLVKRAAVDAEAILKKAKIDAEALAAALQEEARQEIDRAFLKAREDGYAEGYAKGETESARLIAQAQADLEAAAQERIKMQTALEPDMIALIIDITDKLLDIAALLHPETVGVLIRRGLAEANPDGETLVRISPDDYDRVLAQKEALTALTDSSVRLDFVRDPSLQPMDCVIETPFGAVDCSLGRQFEALRDQLTFLCRTA